MLSCAAAPTSNSAVKISMDDRLSCPAVIRGHVIAMYMQGSRGRMEKKEKKKRKKKERKKGNERGCKSRGVKKFDKRRFEI